MTWPKLTRSRLAKHSQYTPKCKPRIRPCPYIGQTLCWMRQDASLASTSSRFNPLPGSVIVCANKSYTSTTDEAKNGCWVWSSIAVAIAGNRTIDANLFIEDAGSLPGSLIQADVDLKLREFVHAVTRSVVLCGQDQSVTYSAIYVSTRNLYVPPNNVGCALACAPYVILAQDAIPGDRQPADLANMTITQWGRALALPSLRSARKRTSNLSRRT